MRSVHTGRYINVPYCGQCPRASQWQVYLLVHYIRGRYGIDIVASTCTIHVTYCHMTILATIIACSKEHPSPPCLEAPGTRKDGVPSCGI
jgi:hypothetical protein